MARSPRRTRRTPVALGLAGVVAVVVALVTPAGAASTTPPSSALVRAAHLAPLSTPPASTPAGATPSGQALSLEFVVSPSHEAQLHALLAAQQDPSSAQYHQWLSPAQYAVRFGPDPATVAALEQWLATQGLRASRASTFALRVQASATAVESGLHVTMRDFLTRAGRRVYAAQQAPLLPDALAGQLVALLGLDDTTHLTSSLEQAPGDDLGPRAGAVQPRADGLSPCSAATNTATAEEAETPDQVGSAYQVGTVTAAGQTGRGQTVGVFELARMSASDVSTYEQCFGLANSVSATSVDGGGPIDVGGTQEADADVEQVATQAPGATIISYQGPNSAQGDFDTWSAIVSADVASAVSTSWGDCEANQETGGSAAADDALFEEAAAQGQTVVAASGDSGAEDCYIDSGLTDTSLDVDFPASDAWVTGVGGTQFTSGTQQTAWNACAGATNATCADENQGEGSGGGGISQYTARPSWQPADWEWTSPAPGCGTDCRDVPDVSANAGTFEVFYAGGSWGAFAGTSIASPLVAGLVADVDTGCSAARKGQLAPLLYGLVSRQEYGIALSDVATGDNDLTDSYGGAYFPAGTGYDPVTGVGTPLAPGWSCPEVTSVSPSSASPGSQVTVGGFDLQKASFSVGGSPATVVSATATSAVLDVPSGSGAVTVHATNSWGTGTSAVSFTYPAVPAAPPPSAAQSGYDLVGRDGGVFVFPEGQSGGFYGSLPGLGVLVGDIVGMVPSPDDGGYFLVGADGGVFAFGDAPFEGSLPGLGVHVDDIRGIVPTTDDRGYFLVGADGGVFAFGDAPYLGSLPGDGVSVDDVVAIASLPGDQGYWVLESDGIVHAFGLATSLGSLTDTTSPAAGLAATPDGGGYWIVTRSGNVFPYGDATWRGSLPFVGVTPASPVIGLVPSADDLGYWLIGADGGIFAFGDAPFVGSLPGLGVHVGDIVGAVPTTL